MIQLFTTLAAVRPRLPAGSHVQGIITAGGTATNIVPDLAVGAFGLRGLPIGALEALATSVTDMATHVAAATGTTVDVTREREPYHHFRNNGVLAERFAGHLEGIEMTPPAPGVFLGSSDIGNISTRLPAIHPFVAIVPADQADHTPEFAAAAASGRGRTVMLAAAGALARTAHDVLARPDVRFAAWEDFRQRAHGEV